MRIDGAGRVGICTGGTVNTNAHANADDFVIGNTSNRTGMTIVSDPAQNGNIHFSDGTSSGNANIKGQISYEHSDNSFRFYVNSATEVLRLTSSGGTVFNNGEDINQNFAVKASGNANALFIDGNGGKVGIGTNAPDSMLHIKASDSGYTGGIQIEDTDSATKSAITHVNGGLYISSNTTADHIAILANGNVGMGVAPYSDAKLTLGGTGSGVYPSVLMFDNNNSSGAEFFMLATDTNWSAGSNKFIMGHGTPGSGNMDVTIDSAGNVGIGTYNPSVNLEVQSSGNTFMFVKNSSSGSGLYFKAATTGAAEIQTAGGSNTMGFRTSGQERVHISSAGYVTMPNLPSFSAVYNGSSWTTSGGNTMVHNYTGAGGHNTGNHYSTSTGRFTAPVAGVYQFNWYSICTGTYNNAYIQFYKNGARMYGGDIHISKDEGGWDTYNWNRTIYLSSGDYIEPKQQGTMTWHGNHWNHFGGFLVG